MKKIEIITDEHRHHVYVGNTDFWLDTQELVELHKKLGHIKLYLSWKKSNPSIFLFQASKTMKGEGTIG